MDFLIFLSNLRTDIGNIFFQSITYLGQESFVIVILCWLFWCSNKRLAYSLGLSYFSSGLLVQGLKITFRIPRPWVLDPEFKAVPSAIPDATGYSFPSGHTQSGTTLFGTLGLHTHNLILRYFYFLLVFLVGFSRMYLGCHTPKDVITSLLISSFFTFICYYLFYIRDFSSKHPLFIAITVLTFSILLSIYAILLHTSDILPIEYARDCLKASGAGVAFAIGFYCEPRYINFRYPETTRKRLSRFIFGLVITLLIQSGLKPILGISLPACFLRYFLTVLWILIIYPLCFTKIEHKRI